MAVTRAGEAPIRSFDDPRLKSMKIGVQMIGDDFASTPPAHALTRRGLIDNVRGYMLYGDYSREAPQAEIVEAVASGEMTWRSSGVPSRLTSRGSNGISSRSRHFPATYLPCLSA